VYNVSQKKHFLFHHYFGKIQIYKIFVIRFLTKRAVCIR